MSPTEAAADDMLENGMRVRRQVLGDAYVDAALASQDSMTEAFQPFMTSYCWGEIWTDDTLPLRERSLLVIAMTAALNRMSELEIHTRGALRNGVTPDQLLAVLKQVTVYCGVPAGVGALKVMRGVVADFEAQENARS
jgi:alkylhydroperoxidase/carboxymuconolactone decarboxylase family protein YurZ